MPRWNSPLPRLIRLSSRWSRTSMPETATQTTVRELTFGEAIREALAEEMRRDPRVCIIGEDVAEAGTPFKVLSGLVEEFGKERVIDTPISEPGFTGIGVGAAMTRLRPVVDIMFGDFLTLVMDQIVNQAAKIHYMSGGTWKVPMVLRTTMGATRRSAAQHSQSLQAWPSHIPGLKVALGAAKLLEDIGISAEVIDPRTTWPLDEKTLIESAKKTSRAVVIDEGYHRYGVTAEIASVIAEGAFYNLDGPVKRIGAMHVPIPFSPPLEDATVPSEQQVFEAARQLCGKS